MKASRIFAGVAVAVLVSLSSVAVGQDKATAEQVVSKVRDAASALSKTGDLAQFNQKQGPWVWADTYVFVQNCDNDRIAAHPMKPELIGQDFMSLKDTKGNPLFQKNYCQEANDGVWSEYWWPKPGETGGFRKLAYGLRVKGTPYVVVSGIYDDKATIEEVSKLTTQQQPTAMAGPTH
jgi:hypothetical protein